MALIISGKSTCAICGLVMNADEEIVGFPHFDGDETSDLNFFSDRGFHKHCFEAHPLRDRAMAAIEAWDRALEAQYGAMRRKEED